MEARVQGAFCMPSTYLSFVLLGSICSPLSFVLKAEISRNKWWAPHEMPAYCTGVWCCLALENTPSFGLSFWCFLGDGSYCQPNAAHCPVSRVGSHRAKACEFLRAWVSCQEKSGTHSGLGYRCLLCRLSQTHLLIGSFSGVLHIDLTLLW